MNTKNLAIGLFLITLAFCNSLSAQDNEEPQYLIDLKTVRFSGFGSTINQLSSVAGDFGVCSGGGGALLLNYTYYIGFYSTELESNHYHEDLYPSDYNPSTNPLPPSVTDLQLYMENNGLWLGYIHNYKNLVHWGANLKIGHGMVGLYDRNKHFYHRDLIFKDNLFVASPEIEAEVNITRWFKVNVGVGYRFTTGFDDQTYTNALGEQKSLYKSSQFSSPYASVKLMFGCFAKRNRSHRVSDIEG